MEDPIINITQLVKQSSTKYTQEEIEKAIRGHILRFNKWIDELAKEHEAEFKQILDDIIKGEQK